MMVSHEGRRLEDEVLLSVFVLDAVRERDGTVRDFEPAGRVYNFEEMVKVVEFVDEVLKLRAAI